MKIRGLYLDEIQNVADNLELELTNVKPFGKFWSFKLSPPHSRHPYAKRALGQIDKGLFVASLS